MPTPPVEKAPERTTPPRRGKWRRRLLWLAVGFSLLAWAINGPVARWAIHFGIDSQLSKQGLSGEATVSGSLLHGFKISNFSYQGDQGIQSLAVDSAEVYYRSLAELSDGKITGFTIHGLDLVLDLEKFSPSEKPPKPISETLGSIQATLYPLDIHLGATKVSLLKSGKPFARFSANSLTTAANSSLYQFNSFQASDGEGRQTAKQAVRLHWDKNTFSTPRLELLPDIALENTALTVSDTLSGSTKLHFLGARFDLSLAETLQLTLESGSLDTRTLNDRFALNLPISGTANSLNLFVKNWRKPLTLWQFDANARFPTISYQNETLHNITLLLHQKKLNYQAQLRADEAQLSLDGLWTNPEAEQWWASSETEFLLTIPSSPVSLKPVELSALTDSFENLDLTATEIDLSGKLTLQDLTLSQIKAQSSISGITLQGVTLPNIALEIDYQHQQTATLHLSTQHNGDTPLSGELSYQFSDDTFKADLTLTENDPDWINQLLANYQAPFTLHNEVDLAWAGTGTSDIEFDQRGTLKVNALTVKTPQTTPLNITSTASYHWPEFVALTDFQLHDARFHTSFDLDWRDNTFTLHRGQLKELGEDTASFRAQFPFSLEIDSAQTFFTQEKPWAISLQSSPLSLPRLIKWFRLSDVPQLRDLEGTSALSLEIAGSPAKPHINGTTKLENLRGIANQDLAALHMLGSFASVNDTLYFSGELLEEKTQRAELSLQLPFTPQKWLQSDAEEILQSTALNGSVKINKLPLNRLARFVKQLKSLDGHLTGSAQLTGTLADPQAQLDTQIKIPKVVIAGYELDDIRDISINCTANTDRKVEAELSASINGGAFTGNASIDFTELNDPRFDISLKTNHAMLFRNDMISMRANADLQLKGSLEQATLSGDLALVESLFYKDIDILPIGVPSSAVADVELPALNPNTFLPEISAPFADWKLDMRLSTQDPLLVRGNLARGKITGNVQATGTLSQPLLDGSIVAKDVTARLPFSLLKVSKGYAHFSPQNGLIPRLDIQGKSTVGNYDTTLYVYGPATSPKTSFISSPPLPQNEIMTLLAAGVTASGLQNNKEVATLRALQLFLVKLRQESGNSKGSQLLEKILSKIQNFELNINDTDHFTGRKFSSAKVNLNRRLYFTAQIDGKKQTRGLLVFVIKSQ